MHNANEHNIRTKVSLGAGDTKVTLSMLSNYE